MKQNISVVIVHFNTPELLKKLLYQLQSTQHHLEIIVVDNASTRSLISLQKAFSNVNFILNEKNQGFSFACNQGVLASHGRWVLFLNPDVLVTAKNCYEMMRWAEEEKLMALTPTFSESGYSKPFPSFFSILQEFTILHRLGFFPKSPLKTLVGGCVLIKKSVIESIGGWDERFFLWFEDSDLTFRLKKNKLVFGTYPNEFFHLGGASVARLAKTARQEYFFHSLEVFSKKHFRFWQQKIIQLCILNRFTAPFLTPVSNTGYTWVVPNMIEDLLIDFLETNNHFFSKEHQLIIVSSGLKSKNIWSYRRKYPSIRFILTDTNKGFSSMVNIGLRAATTPFVGTLNDDIILNKSSLSNLVKRAPESFGSLNPIILSLDEEIESAGISILKKGKALPITTVPNTILSSTQVTNAACVLYSHHALDQVGLFDERFGSYLEDIDLSLRLDRAGFSQYVVKDSRVIHARHQTSKRFSSYKKWLDVKNWWLVILKNWSISDLFLNAPQITLERVKNIYGLVK